MSVPDPGSLFHPVAGCADLVPRHVVPSRLFGRELAVWRADDGFINIWEDRCIHRGTRLSLGINDGAELVCQYHGWRYANRNGNCAYIPAHPGEAPARTMRLRVFACAEKYGLVWSGSPSAAGPPSIPALEGAEVLVLRSLPVNAPAAVALEALAGYSFRPAAALGTDTAVATGTHAPSPYSVTVTAATTTGAESSVVFFVQPADAARCVIRPVLSPAPAPEEHLAVLRHHARRLEELRAKLEDSRPTEIAVQPPMATLEPLHSDGIAATAGTAGGRRPQVQVRVVHKWLTAEGIAAFELAPVAGELPSFQPGAHLDVHLPDGLVRQYSLTNGPGLTGVYRIGVKLEPEGRGGSRYLHDSVHVGDVLDLSVPRNNFTLRRDAARTVLIAGGIGITPLLAMAQTLDRQGLTWELRYFAQSGDHIAFGEMLDPLARDVTMHLGLTPEQTGDELRRITRSYAPTNHTYICGPGPMIAAARAIAAEAGWPEAAVHFEYFKNESPRDDTSAFEVRLARRNKSLTIHAGVSLLDGFAERGGRPAVVLRARRLRDVHRHGPRGRAGSPGRLSQRFRARRRRPDAHLRLARPQQATRAGSVGHRDQALRLPALGQLLQATAAAEHAGRAS